MKSCSGKRFVAILKRRKWTHVRTKGSHQTWHSPDGQRSATVPVHANEDLKTGLLAGLLKDAGLTQDDL